MKIYTKTGDTGTTGLIGGERVSKHELAIECFGSLDELNSMLGHTRAAGQEWMLDILMDRIQRAVFEIGSEVASPQSHRQSQRAELGTIVADLERSIDVQEALLPKLANFVLPGGSELASRLHLSRVFCRRAERRLVALAADQSVRPELLSFLNRLSDWLFVAARTANHDAGRTETVWTKDN